MTRFSFSILALLIFALFGMPHQLRAEAIEIQPAASADAFSNLQALDSGSMEKYSGGSKAAFHQSIANSSAVSSNNTINGGVGFTGGISGNTLSANSGLTTMIANTGNQVSISQSTIVNVFLQ